MAGSQDIGALVVTLEAQTAAFEKGMASATTSLNNFGRVSKDVERQFGGIQGAIKNFNASLEGLRNAVGIVKAVVGAFQGFVKPREDLIALRASFTELMGSAESAADMVTRIYMIADEIGIKLPEATNAVRRMSTSLVALGYSNKEIAQVAETFLKIGAVTSSVNEASGAVFQFSQALGAGALRGDELVSLLERQPAIAIEISKYLKEVGLASQGTVSELRALATQGKVTTEVLVDAFIGTKDKWDAAFEKMPVKMEQVLNRMAISWQKFQIAISEKFLLNEKMAAALQEVQKLFQTFLNNVLDMSDSLGALAVVVTLVAVKLVSQLIPAIRGATIAATLFSAATGWGAILVALSAMALFWDKIIIGIQEADLYLVQLQLSFAKFLGNDTKPLEDKIDKITKKLIDTKKRLARQGDVLAEGAGERDRLAIQDKKIQEFISKMKEAADDAKLLNKKIAALNELIAAEKDPRALKALNDELKKLQKTASEGSPFQEWLKGLTSQEVGGTLKSVMQQLDALQRKMKETTDPIQLEIYTKAYEEILNKMQSATTSKGVFQVREASENFQKQMKINAEALSELNDQFALGQISAKEYYAQLGSYDQTPFAEIEIAIYNANKQLEEMPIKLALIDKALAEGRITPETWEKMRDNIQGVDSDMQKLGESITNSIASNANNAVNNFIDNLGKAKFSFTDFATSVIKDLAKIMMQMLIMAPLVKSFQSFLKGGLATDAGPELLNPFAKGGSFENGTGLAHGVYNSPTLFKFAKGGTFGRLGVLGEAGAEAIMPLKRGSDGKLGVSSAPTTVNIYNNAAVEVTATENTNADGMKSVDILIEKKVKDMFGTGQMDKSMKSAYGLNRAAA
jgi:tape measure domain-containing protein